MFKWCSYPAQLSQLARCWLFPGSPALAWQLISRGLNSLPGIPSTIVTLVNQEQFCCWGLICTKPAEVLHLVLFPLQYQPWTQPRVKAVEQLCLFLNASEVKIFENLSMFKLDFYLYRSENLHFLLGHCCTQWFCLCSWSKSEKYSAFGL